MNINLGPGVTLADMKNIDVGRSRQLAREALKAEWAEEYILAELKWRGALFVCEQRSETLCMHRIDTCHWLAVHRAKDKDLFNVDELRLYHEK